MDSSNIFSILFELKSAFKYFVLLRILVKESGKNVINYVMISNIIGTYSIYNIPMADWMQNKKENINKFKAFEA